MRLSLRTRLLGCVVLPFGVVLALTLVRVPVEALAAVIITAAAASVTGVVWVTGSCLRLIRRADRELQATRQYATAADSAAPTRGDGTEQVDHVLGTLSQRLKDSHSVRVELERQFKAALEGLSGTLVGMAANPARPVAYPPPETPWPQYSTAVSGAVAEVAGVLAQTNRRALGFSGVLNDLADPVLVIDSQKQLMFMNAAAGRLFEVDPAVAVRKPVSSFFREPGLDLWEDSQAQTLPREQLLGWLGQPNGGSCEAIAATGDDGGARVSVSVLPAPARGIKAATVLLLKDLTTQKKLDSDVRLHHRRTVAQRLCLLVENEARPALESIRTSATLLAQAAKQIGQRERFVPKVQRMMDELSRQEVVITLLGWLGKLTKSFGGSQELTEVRLRDQVDDVTDKLKAVYGDRGNEVEVSGDAGWLIADEEWVGVLLTGLLLHANMTAKQGRVRVELSRRSVVSADREQGEILVRYAGVPLPDEAVADVREPFRRPNSLALESTSELGFPLGLAVANRIAGLMGGQLVVGAEGAECLLRVTVPTRATGSRIESMAAATRTAPAASVEVESTELLGDWLVGGGTPAVGDPLPATTPAPVGVAVEPIDAAGETVGDWFKSGE